MDSSIDLAVDTSALTAIMLHEPEAREFLLVLAATDRIGLSAVNKTEFLIVTRSRLGVEGVHRALDLLARFAIEIIPTDERYADLAAEAYSRFGKGCHPARLNFGDCFAYALAKHNDVPLLFKGNDFSRTDITCAMGGASP